MHGTGACALLTVLEVDEVRVVAIIEIVDAEEPFMGCATLFLRPDSADIETVVVGCAVAVTLGIIVDPVVDDLVFAARSGKCLTTVEYPGCAETPPWCQTVHRHQIDVVTTVVVGVIPASFVNAFNLGLQPRQRIA